MYGELPIQLAMLDDPIDAAFFEFHRKNPQVYRQLVALARQWKEAGHDKCSIDMLFHLLRWKYGIRTEGHDGPKLNDHWTSRYSRAIATNEPDLAGMFTTRRIKADFKSDWGRA